MDKCCQNRGTSVFPGRVSTLSGHGRSGSRHGGGMNSEQALISFDFLGYTFRPRWIKKRRGQQGLYFLAAISQKSAKRIRQEINRWPWRYWRQKELMDIERYCQNRLRAWLVYYGLFGKSIIRNVLFHFD